jgi:hypothetical protein
VVQNHCTCHIAFDFVGKKNQLIVLRNVKFMMQCVKEDSGARLVNPWIMEQKTNLVKVCWVHFSFAQAIFCQVSFLGFINGKTCWYSNFSCVRQLYEMKGVKFMVTREMH